jgi:hypothetical protein
MFALLRTTADFEAMSAAQDKNRWSEAGRGVRLIQVKSFSNHTGCLGLIPCLKNASSTSSLIST